MDVAPEKTRSRPTFLVRKMGRTLRLALEADVDATTSLQEVIRRILCEHYDLDCSPIRGHARRDTWKRTDTVVVEMQPELFSAIKQDAASSGETMRAIVLRALEDHYERTSL